MADYNTANGQTPYDIAIQLYGSVEYVGEVAKHKAPLPVSFEIIPANSAEVVEANEESLSLVSAIVPLASGIVSVRVVAVVIPEAWN